MEVLKQEITDKNNVKTFNYYEDKIYNISLICNNKNDQNQFISIKIETKLINNLTINDTTNSTNETKSKNKDDYSNDSIENLVQKIYYKEYSLNQLHSFHKFFLDFETLINFYDNISNIITKEEYKITQNNDNIEFILINNKYLGDILEISLTIPLCSKNKIIKNKEWNNHTTNSNSHLSDPYIYIVGGRDRGKTLAKIERYSIIKNTWEKCGQFSENRGSLGLVSINKYLIIIGGGGLHSNLSTCEVYDTIENKISFNIKIPDISKPRHALNCVIIDNQIFSIGGWIAGTISANIVESYKIDLDKEISNTKQEWTQHSELINARRLHGTTVFEDYIYVFGGSTEKGDMDSVERYNIKTDKWEERKKLPFKARTQAVTIGNYIYVMIMPRCIMRYDPAKDLYSKVENGDFPLMEWYSFCAVAFKEYIYILSGSTKDGLSNQVFSFNTLTFKWDKKTEMLKGRRRSAAILLE